MANETNEATTANLMTSSGEAGADCAAEPAFLGSTGPLVKHAATFAFYTTWKGVTRKIHVCTKAARNRGLVR